MKLQNTRTATPVAVVIPMQPPTYLDALSFILKGGQRTRVDTLSFFGPQDRQVADQAIDDAIRAHLIVSRFRRWTQTEWLEPTVALLTHRP